MQRHTRWVVALIIGFVVIIGSVPSGHTPIASRWNYNEHLFPIFRDRCGSCHIDGGVGPMSLVNYQEAYPWTQSIREEILGLRMPPWQAEDGFREFQERPRVDRDRHGHDPRVVQRRVPTGSAGQSAGRTRGVGGLGASASLGRSLKWSNPTRLRPTRAS